MLDSINVKAHAAKKYWFKASDLGGSSRRRWRRRRRRVFRDRFHDLISMEPEGSAVELRLRRFPLLHRAISSAGAFALPISASSSTPGRRQGLEFENISNFPAQEQPASVFGYLPAGEAGCSRGGARRCERIKARE